MELMVGVFRSLILLGAIQGFIVSFLLRSSARRDPFGGRSKRLLAVLILLMALACLNLYLFETPGLLDTPIGNMLSALIPLVIVMPLGPLVYSYVRSCLEPEFRLSRRHFYSVAIDLAPHAASLIYIILLIVGVLSPRKSYGFGTFLDYYDQYADIPRWLSLTIYLLVTSRYIARVRASAADGASVAGGGSLAGGGSVAAGGSIAGGRSIAGGVSLAGGSIAGGGSTPARDPRLTWPTAFLRVFSAFAILWFVFLVPYEIPRYSDALIDRFDWYPLYLPIVLMIYWLGVKGYFISYRAIAPPVTDKEPALRAALSPEIVASAVLALKKAMEEDRLWLDPALNLGGLARHCRLAPKILSAVLNQHLEKTFNEWINEYRIAAFKDRLSQPESRELTIAGLAYNCGFNSLPTFQRAFKSFTGITPREYMQKIDQIRI
jgi:AraC-like DNA-binding protein